VGRIPVAQVETPEADLAVLSPLPQLGRFRRSCPGSPTGLWPLPTAMSQRCRAQVLMPRCAGGAASISSWS